MGRLSWRAHKMRKRDAVRPMSPQVGTLHSGCGPHTLFAACMRASPSPGEVRNALCAISRPPCACHSRCCCCCSYLITHTAARSAGCRNLRCRLRHPRHRHVSRRSGRAHSCSWSRTRLLSRQVHLASVLQRRVPQPLQPASVLVQRRVPQPLHLATVPRRRVPQLLQPQLRCYVGACLSRSNLLSVPRRHVPQLLHPATVPRRRVPQPLQPATVPRRRVPQLLQPATVPRRRVPLGSCSSQAADWPPACFCCA
jgi:hypothetical protein